jgi:hypothetical protein
VQSCNRLEIHISAANVLVGYGIPTTPQYVKWALLDSGSEANCISGSLAHELGAVVESEPECEHRTELKTADGTPLEHIGRTKLRISWLSGSFDPWRRDVIGEAKIKCYVVPNLQYDVVLSEATTHHHELRDAATSSLNYLPIVFPNTVAPIKFNRRSEKDKKDDEAHLEKTKADALTEEQKKKAERRAVRDQMQTRGVGGWVDDPREPFPGN